MQSEERSMIGERFFCVNLECTYVGPHEKLSHDNDVSLWACPKCGHISSLRKAGQRLRPDMLERYFNHV